MIPTLKWNFTKKSKK
jgi:hypothetical protein